VGRAHEKKQTGCFFGAKNQKNMYTEIKEYFDFTLNDEEELSKMLRYETKSFGHGRIETRGRSSRRIGITKRQETERKTN